MSRIVVIGSGLIGLTSAYFLRRRGHEVTVIDRDEGPGRETSFANGALLTPSMAEPWNTPGCWRVLLASLGRSDAALQLRLRALPGMAGWGIQFLRDSELARFERSALVNLRLALHSLEVMQALRRDTGIEYGRTTRGTLKIFRDRAALDRAGERARRMSSEGLVSRPLSSQETVSLEPALAPIAGQLTGAIHYENDETGDAYRFCLGLAERAGQQGVEFRFRTEVSSLEVRSGQVTAVLIGRERLEADRYVVAAGSYTSLLLRRLGMDVPVRPAKGYSVTFPAASDRPSLGIPIVDDHWHAAVVPLKGAIRVVGTAEFAGYDRTLTPSRIRNLLMLLRQVMPEAPIDLAAGAPWCGLRPMSVDGVPIIGPTPISNLFVNTGHGHLGWTMAAASGQLLAEVMGGEKPSVEPEPYGLDRFA